jgi:hypothetical protein
MMMVGGTPKNKKTLCFMAFLALLLSYNSVAQTKVYATAIAAQNEVETPANSYDGNLSTRARVKASSGVVAGIGAYSGYLELQFATTLPANTTTYVKIATDDNLLPYLLGGTLGTLLANIGGALLIGNQEFTVEARNTGGTVVLDGDSQVAGDFADARLKIVVNTAGDYYIRLTPNAAYNRIRLTNRLGSLIGLGATKRLDVYEAFYVTNPPVCASPEYTSFSGSGLSLSVLQLGQAGVTNPQYAIDASTTNFSVLNLGLLGAGAQIEQTVYFEGPSQATDQFGVRIRMTQSLLDLSVSSHIRIIASNGGTVVQDQTLSYFLTLSLLSLQGGQITTVPLYPGVPVDRITVQFSSFASASVAQTLDFFGVTRTLAMPVISQNLPVCQGSAASITAATTTGTQLKWYSTASGGTPLATLTSGQAFTTPALQATTTYYVSQVNGICESLLLPVVAEVIAVPGSGIIAGGQTICYNKVPVALTSVLVENGTGISYRWESSADEVSWTLIAGANLAVYQPEALPATTFFRRVTIRTVNGVGCESVPTNHIKIIAKNCMVYTNPMIAQRIKNGA